MNRFTRRRVGSNWSAVNIGRVAALAEAGRMHPAGLKAFEAWREGRSGIHSYEQRDKAVVRSVVREALPREEEGVGCVRGDAQVLSTGGDPLGHVGEGGDARTAIRDAGGRHRRGEAGRAARTATAGGREIGCASAEGLPTMRRGRSGMAKGKGTPEDPWVLQTPSGQSEFEMHRDPDAEPPALVCRVGKTELRMRAI